VKKLSVDRDVELDFQRDETKGSKNIDGAKVYRRKEEESEFDTKKVVRLFSSQLRRGHMGWRGGCNSDNEEVDPFSKH